MKAFLFVHGKNPSLSKYELLSVFGDEISFQSDLFSVLETSSVIDEKVMDRLGGTIKICEVFSAHPVDIIERSAKTDKIVFGLSLYGGHDRISTLLISLKKELKKRGRNARFLNKNFTNVSSGQLNKSKLLEKGVDLVRCRFKGQERWGRTIAFQNIDAYSKRDYDRPKRDMKVGMMPPKLAQMMINFAQPKKSTTIYDPFCGLGTILMEALLMGYPVMGSDIKGRLIDSTIKNLEWLGNQFERAPSTIDHRHFFQHDATQPFSAKKFPKDLVVVTESYLGPPLLRFPQQQQQKEIFELLHGINSKFFLEVSHIIKKGRRLVMTFPFFRSKQDRFFYPEAFFKEYEQAGFSIQSEKRSLLYERQTQVVGREVVVMEKA